MNIYIKSSTYIEHKTPKGESYPNIKQIKLEKYQINWIRQHNTRTTL